MSLLPTRKREAISHVRLLCAMLLSMQKTSHLLGLIHHDLSTALFAKGMQIVIHNLGPLVQKWGKAIGFEKWIVKSLEKRKVSNALLLQAFGA